jgi:hypothetical protein
LKSLYCQETFTMKIAIENPMWALLFIIVLVKKYCSLLYIEL